MTHLNSDSIKFGSGLAKNTENIIRETSRKKIISKVTDLDAAAAHKVEVLAQDLPDAGPLETNPAHVVVGDLHQLR
jgi:hypothetical protein